EVNLLVRAFHVGADTRHGIRTPHAAGGSSSGRVDDRFGLDRATDDYRTRVDPSVSLVSINYVGARDAQIDRQAGAEVFDGAQFPSTQNIVGRTRQAHRLA